MDRKGMNHNPIVAVVGRPNVGKSTLFNRLIHERRAIVDDQPGVTRDRHYASASWQHRDFLLMDTGGYVPEGKDLFNTAIREQVQLGIEEADLILLVCDVQTGVTSVDQLMARWIRDTGKPCLLAVNKVDNERLELEVGEFWKLGLDEPLPVSANSGRHSGELLDALVAALPQGRQRSLEGDLRIAVVGRPNVGKSSFVNRLLGQDRLMVTPVAGTTRDAIDSIVKHEGRRLVLVDTAGLRRRTKIKENVEFYSGLRSRTAIESSDVCVLLLDAVEGLTSQDIQVLEAAISARKGVIIAVNKWDLIPDKETNTARDYQRRLHEQVPTLRWVPVVFVSALTGQRVRRVLDLCLDIDRRRRVHISRAALEEALLPEVEKRPPAARKGRWVRIEGVRQVRGDPPWIVFQCNHPDLVEEHYKRFLENRLRARFPLSGVPLRLDLRRRGDFIHAFGEMPPIDVRPEDAGPRRIVAGFYEPQREDADPPAALAAGPDTGTAGDESGWDGWEEGAGLIEDLDVAEESPGRDDED
jgi:GTPase